MRSYSHKGILMPTPRRGFVHFAGATLTTDEARKLADDLREAADTADLDMAQLRSGLMHKLN